jgi:membrane protease YdiL (CAAX protease family)
VWNGLWVTLRAVVLGLIVSLVGTTPWAVLVALNARHVPTIPWAVLPTAIYLWLFWRYIRGEGWPRSTSSARREHCRANPLSGEVWGAAILAGIVGLAALVAFMRVFARISGTPIDEAGQVPQVSTVTLFGWIVMSALVAGFCEEAAFRGYMQGPIERQYGPVVAILATGIAFGFAHLSHPQVTVTMLPYYLAVAAVYGGLAYITNSILPSIALHAGGNMLSALSLFQQGTPPVHHAHAAAQASIWQTGPDNAFWVSLTVLIALTGAAIWAYYGLAHVVAREKYGRVSAY